MPVEADFAISADKSEYWKSYHVKPQLSPEPSHPILGINCPLPADWEPSHCWWEIQLISTEFILATAGAQYDVWRGTALLQKSIIPPSHTSEPCLAPILQSWLYGHWIGTNTAETYSSSVLYLPVSDQLSANFSRVGKCAVISKVTHGVPQPISAFTLRWAPSKAEQLSNRRLSWSVKIGVRGSGWATGWGERSLPRRRSIFVSFMCRQVIRSMDRQLMF